MWEVCRIRCSIQMSIIVLIPNRWCSTLQNPDSARMRREKYLRGGATDGAHSPAASAQKPIPRTFRLGQSDLHAASMRVNHSSHSASPDVSYSRSSGDSYYSPVPPQEARTAYSAIAGTTNRGGLLHEHGQPPRVVGISGDNPYGNLAAPKPVKAAEPAPRAPSPDSDDYDDGPTFKPLQYGGAMSTHAGAAMRQLESFQAGAVSNYGSSNNLRYLEAQLAAYSSPAAAVRHDPAPPSSVYTSTPGYGYSSPSAAANPYGLSATSGPSAIPSYTPHPPSARRPTEARRPPTEAARNFSRGGSKLDGSSSFGMAAGTGMPPFDPTLESTFEKEIQAIEASQSEQELHMEAHAARVEAAVEAAVAADAAQYEARVASTHDTADVLREMEERAELELQMQQYEASKAAISGELKLVSTRYRELIATLREADLSVIDRATVDALKEVRCKEAVVLFPRAVHWLTLPFVPVPCVCVCHHSRSGKQPVRYRQRTTCLQRLRPLPAILTPCSGARRQWALPQRLSRSLKSACAPWPACWCLASSSGSSSSGSNSCNNSSVNQTAGGQITTTT